VAELKVVEDDGMLFQGLDYYDHVSTHIESFARLYRAHSISPTQQVRLLLVAPSFSQAVINRCKWFKLLPSLYTFVCLKFEGEDDLVPVVSEQQVPTPPETIEVAHCDDHINYITDSAVRAKATALLAEIEEWRPENISLDAIKDAISMKVNNRVFAYFVPGWRHYVIHTYDGEGEWKPFPIKSDDDLTKLMPSIKTAMEKRLK
jgi:hypothetical protein